MFSEIKDDAKKFPMYFGDREVDGYQTLEHPNENRVILTFKEGLPKTEEMTEKEWEAGRTAKAMTEPSERQESFINRSVPVAIAAQKTLMEFNPRFWEVSKLIERITDGLNYAYGEALAYKFGVKSFQGDVSIDTIFKKVEETGVDPLEGMSEREKALIGVLRTNETKVWEVASAQVFTGITGKILASITKATDLVLGVPEESLRTDDIENILKEYAKKDNVSDAKSEGNDENVKPSGDGSSAEQGSKTAEPAIDEKKPVDGVQEQS